MQYKFFINLELRDINLHKQNHLIQKETAKFDMISDYIEQNLRKMINLYFRSKEEVGSYYFNQLNLFYKILIWSNI